METQNENCSCCITSYQLQQVFAAIKHPQLQQTFCGLSVVQCCDITGIARQEKKRKLQKKRVKLQTEITRVFLG